MTLPRHLSPSGLALYAWCPAKYAARYLRGEREPMGLEQAFGLAVHAGIEQSYRDGDGETAFLRAWNGYQPELRAQGLRIAPHLDGQGVRLVRSVVALDLAGEPEVWCELVLPDVPVRLRGRADLWDIPGRRIVDFKTTAWLGAWGEAARHRGRFQRLVYSAAFLNRHGDWPTFEYIELPRVGKPLNRRHEDTPSMGEMETVIAEIKTIIEAIDAGQFACTCAKHVHEQAA
jgi:hypothetical protein